MRILGLEASGYSGSVALVDDETRVAQIVLPERQRTAQGLAPAIADALASAGWRPRDIELVAVTSGPGSFTGLRVGVMTAKGFAYAVDAQVLAVDTLDVLAQQAPIRSDRLSTILDAQRNQLFEASFARSPDGSWQRLTATRIIDEAAWLTEVTAQSASTDWSVTGAALGKLGNRRPPSLACVDADAQQPLAASVCAVALRDYRGGRRDDLWQLTPQYYRPSAAEEQQAKAAEKNA
ncbi:MAG: tRNA (adenosine(37)-N6)-threonylcarbamoyltransferase complex dimerization subunit type 1 TsaB [Planctomycetota bacterium]